MDKKINLSEKLATFFDYFSPRTVAQLNEYDVMVVKLKGEFVWHKHDETDDFFLVLKGKLDIQLRDRTVSLGPGEMFIAPKGVEHRPVAEEEVHASDRADRHTQHRRREDGGATKAGLAVLLRRPCTLGQSLIFEHRSRTSVPRHLASGTLAAKLLSALRACH